MSDDEQTENRSNQQTVNSTSLWIGNVDPLVTERTLTEIFSAYGDLNNVRCLPEKCFASILKITLIDLFHIRNV